MSSIFQAIRTRIAAVRSKAAATASSPYWRAAEALAAGEEPKVRDEQLLESMRELRKDEGDLETDAQLLAELRAAEVVAMGAGSTRDSVAQLRRQAHALTLEAEKQEAAARANRAESERLSHAASAAERSAEDAQRTAAQLKRQLSERGHNVYRSQVAAIDEQQARENKLAALDDQLRTARADLAVEEQALAQEKNRKQPDHLEEQAAEFADRAAESLQIRQEARDRVAAKVLQLEQQRQQLTAAAAAEPALQA